MEFQKPPFHPSLLTLTLFTTFSGQAALYQAVEVGSPTESVESYGIALENELGSTDCFTDYCAEYSYLMAGDTLNATEGFSLKDEVLYGYDNGFYYLDYDDLETYCDYEYGYSTCEFWAYYHWYGDESNDIGGLKNEREAYYQSNYQQNATAFFRSETSEFIPDEGSYAPPLTEYSYWFVEGTEEKVVNTVDDDDAVIGNTSSGYYNYNDHYVRLYRSRGYYLSSDETIILEPEAEEGMTLTDEEGEQYIVNQMGSTSAFDTFTYSGEKYVVGSAAVAPFVYDDSDKDYDSENTSDSDNEDVTNCVDDYSEDSYEPALQPECQNFGFAHKAFIWNLTDNDGPNTDSNRFAVTDWQTDTSDEYEYNDDAYSAQASVRAAAIAQTGSYDSLPILVGYNTAVDDYNNFYMQAAVFRPSNLSAFEVTENAWQTVFIDNVEVEEEDYIYSSSMATGINDNLVVIGHAKRDGDNPYNGVSDDRMFVANAADTTPSASFFDNHGQDVFFDSAAGNANAINNFNEIVGFVDAESFREVDSKQRDHRGFIYPYDELGTDESRLARFKSQPWWLDDLTNGGEYSSQNNHFRIIDASDINDAGVISATAIQCFEDESATSSMEYDSTEHFSYCNEGVGDERVVAVKLIPIQGAEAADISQRTEDTSVITRNGASLGLYTFLVLFGLGSIRQVRKRKKK
ncbi:DUF3466 family protein [Vibrio ulleungensis]|uniref:DUF3466 family protein n=1 Tax=Vibrio ulleungensis TaxID=2807619 RepID=A0ABS2HHI6_9VIBR|nr:DUF3466 family protein [Vibrio ulleungensis]MBM7036469.1 DUF3466 family protein [Vibrio ulleungensis]